MTTINSDIFSSLGLATQAEDTTPKNDLGMEDFMNLMVTELTHQDPFKPMENSELATQISQFATVSGIDDLNSSFNNLQSSLTSDQALQAANLVGHNVLVYGNAGALATGGSLSGAIDLPSAASNVKVQVTDASGALVREISLGTHEGGQVNFSWDGTDNNGDFMAPGYYQVNAVASTDEGEFAPAVMISAQVESVNLGGANGLQLNLAGLGQVSMNQVAQIQ